ncbi:MAG: CBS domain-containing protein [Myxococcota bacterium]|nr:CBS domain-containing protein [Myxococcota bacterium]
MTTTETLVTAYMTHAVEAVSSDAPLAAIVHLLQSRRISSVPVVDDAGVPIGVISRTDLIKLGIHQVALRGTTPALPLPSRTARQLMTPAPRVIGSDRPLREAARTLVQNAIHRLFVVDDGRLTGVLSTLDLAAAVRDSNLVTPISAWMATPVVTVELHQPIAAAIHLLDRLHVSAVVVVEDGWPVGMFSQLEALLARDLRRDTPIESVMDTAMICLPETIRTCRAADHAARLDVRRVIAIRAREVVGILSGLDFARIAAG